MKRMIAAALTAMALMASAEAAEPKWTESEVTIGEGDGTLYGTFLEPQAVEGGLQKLKITEPTNFSFSPSMSVPT